MKKEAEKDIPILFLCVEKQTWIRLEIKLEFYFKSKLKSY
jgi:hypothetical protein